MVTLPAEGRWSLRPLTDDDSRVVLRYLQRDPLVNVYLISRIQEERAVAATQIFAVRHDGSIVVVASLATNVVLAADPDDEGRLVDTGISLVADRILTRMLPVRAIISPAPLVDRLWERLRSHLDPPTVVRMNQPVYALPRRLDLPDLETVRYATMRDLDQLVPACAAMHKEEVGIDPLERDPAGYRERIRELIERKRALVRMERGLIAAKCEYSAVTDRAVQLMGVWTDPRFRRRGLGRQTLREVCGHISRQGKQVTLFVNDFNEPAIRLYKTLGFTRIGMNRALIW